MTTKAPSPSRGLGRDDWGSLSEMVCRGRCVLMLGPEAIRVGKRHVPLARKFSDELRKLIPARDRPAAGTGFRQVAEKFIALHRDRTALERHAARVFSCQRRKVWTEPLADLAALRFQLVVSTTLDLEFDKVLDAQKGWRSRTRWYEFEGDYADTEDLDENDTLVYHLFGCIEEKKSLVLTESDLLDFLVRVIQDKPALPVTIRGELARGDTSFLFIGFSFRQWYLRILLHVLAHSGGNIRSFALDSFEAVPQTMKETISMFYREGHNLLFFDMDLDEFAAELRKRCEISKPRRPRAYRDPTLKSATVFLCHASKDKKRAGQLRRQLQAKGLSVWRDENNLRPGEKWDPVIRETIGDANRVQYFVVLQSPALARKTEGYVFKEIRVALERSEGFAKGINFVHPVFVEGQKRMLPGLEELHAIDLESKKEGQGVKGLFDAIARDWQLRKSRE